MKIRRILCFSAALVTLLGSAPVILAESEENTILRPRPADIQPLASRNLLLDVVHTGQHLVAVGDRGHVLISVDGSQWVQAEVPVRAALTSVAFADDGRTGWAVGHDATILHTTDGGANWTIQNFEPELERPFLDIKVLSDQHVIVVGAYGMMRVTRDGGSTWDDVDAPEMREDEFHLNSITELDSGLLLVAGEMGLLAVSGDQGERWTRLESPYEGSFFGAIPTGDSGVLVYGLRGTLFVIDAVSEDSEADDWISIDNDTVATMFGGARLAERQVALVGLNGVVTLIDGIELRFRRTERGTALSSLVPFEGGLLAVGESGVQRIALSSSAQ